MTKELFNKLNQYNPEYTYILDVHNLRPYVYDKTLLYGYTCERETFHVYIKNEKIYVVVYYQDYSQDKIRPKNMRQLRVTSNHDYVPDKRLYPERCDYEFCRLLKEKGIDLPFTNWNDNIKTDLEDTRYPYYGFTLEDIE